MRDVVEITAAEGFESKIGQALQSPSILTHHGLRSL
jgi:hypothetical protein